MKRSIRNLVIHGGRPEAGKIGPGPDEAPPSCDELDAGCCGGFFRKNSFTEMREKPSIGCVFRR